MPTPLDPRKPFRSSSKRNRKQAQPSSKPTSLAVDTSVSRHQGLAPQQVFPVAADTQEDRFVSLADIRGLKHEVIDSKTAGQRQHLDSKVYKRAPVTNKNIPRNVENASNASNVARPATRSTSLTNNVTGTPISLQLPSKRRINQLRTTRREAANEISPSDCAIRIGIAVPSAAVSQHTDSPQSGTQYPLPSRRASVLRYNGKEAQTPTIVVTPARDDFDLDNMSPAVDMRSEAGYRPDQECYARYTNKMQTAQPRDGQTPPVPPLPLFAAESGVACRDFAAESSIASRDGTRYSIMTEFEEEEAPPPPYSASSRGDHALSVCTTFDEQDAVLQPSSPFLVNQNRLTTSSAAIPTPRRSKGWWNLVTSPFVSSAKSGGSFFRSPLPDEQDDEHSGQHLTTNSSIDGILDPRSGLGFSDRSQDDDELRSAPSSEDFRSRNLSSGRPTPQRSDTAPGALDLGHAEEVNIYRPPSTGDAAAYYDANRNFSNASGSPGALGMGRDMSDNGMQDWSPSQSVFEESRGSEDEAGLDDNDFYQIPSQGSAASYYDASRSFPSLGPDEALGMRRELDDIEEESWSPSHSVLGPSTASGGISSDDSGAEGFAASDDAQRTSLSDATEFESYSPSGGAVGSAPFTASSRGLTGSEMSPDPPATDTGPYGARSMDDETSSPAADGYGTGDRGTGSYGARSMDDETLNPVADGYGTSDRGTDRSPFVARSMEDEPLSPFANRHATSDRDTDRSPFSDANARSMAEYESAQSAPMSESEDETYGAGRRSSDNDTAGSLNGYDCASPAPMSEDRMYSADRRYSSNANARSLEGYGGADSAIFSDDDTIRNRSFSDASRMSLDDYDDANNNSDGRRSSNTKTGPLGGYGIVGSSSYLENDFHNTSRGPFRDSGAVDFQDFSGTHPAAGKGFFTSPSPNELSMPSSYRPELARGDTQATFGTDNTPVVENAHMATLMGPQSVNGELREVDIASASSRTPASGLRSATITSHDVDDHPLPTSGYGARGDMVSEKRPYTSSTMHSRSDSHGLGISDTDSERELFPPPKMLSEKPRLGTDRFGQLHVRGGGDENAEDGPKRPWYRRFMWLLVGICGVLLVPLIVLLVIFLPTSRNDMPVEAKWLSLTGFPPMPTGVTTVVAPKTVNQVSGCVGTPELWTCKAPVDEAESTQSGQPNFRFEIRFRNHTLPSNETGLAPMNSTLSKRQSSITAHAGAFAKRSLWPNTLYSASPAPPSTQDQTFLGRTTDKVSEPYDGEETPFYITLLNATVLEAPQSTGLRKRDAGFHYPYPTTSTATSSSLTSSPQSSASSSIAEIYPYPISSSTGFGAHATSTSGSAATASRAPVNAAQDIPKPALGADGKPALAEVYPFVYAQPLRLFNRGQNSEHYGFYTYFDRSFYLAHMPGASAFGNNNSTTSGVTGNVPLTDASAVCTWSQTRLLVQIWTRKAAVTALNSTDSASTSTANDMSLPGSFPYSVTITLDRHGGDATQKALYCYGLDATHQVQNNVKTWISEDRGFEGHLVDAAGVPTNNGTRLDKRSSASTGGVDGGSGGCSCQWRNY